MEVLFRFWSFRSYPDRDIPGCRKEPLTIGWVRRALRARGRGSAASIGAYCCPARGHPGTLPNGPTRTNLPILPMPDSASQCGACCSSTPRDGWSTASGTGHSISLRAVLPRAFHTVEMVGLDRGIHVGIFGFFNEEPDCCCQGGKYQEAQDGLLAEGCLCSSCSRCSRIARSFHKRGEPHDLHLLKPGRSQCKLDHTCKGLTHSVPISAHENLGLIPRHKSLMEAERCVVNQPTLLSAGVQFRYPEVLAGGENEASRRANAGVRHRSILSRMGFKLGLNSTPGSRHIL